MSDRLTLSQKNEVLWYRQHGRHANKRIARNRTNEREYVIGDWAWNRYHSPAELIEERMRRFVNELRRGRHD